jgi:hypothetical protein
MMDFSFSVLSHHQINPNGHFKKEDLSFLSSFLIAKGVLQTSATTLCFA